MVTMGFFEFNPIHSLIPPFFLQKKTSIPSHPKHRIMGAPIKHGLGLANVPWQKGNTNLNWFY
jgi:hypothetical protein